MKRPCRKRCAVMKELGAGVCQRCKHGRDTIPTILGRWLDKALQYDGWVKLK